MRAAVATAFDRPPTTAAATVASLVTRPSCFR
jgi:hypothetical protein